MTYIELPKNIDNLVKRLGEKATTDTYIAIATKFDNLKPTTWFNLPFQLNKIMDIIKEYQELLNNSDIQDLIDKISIIYWYDVLDKTNKLVELTEVIEAI